MAKRNSSQITLRTSVLILNFQRLTLEEQGASVRMLALAANHGGPIPDDEILVRNMGVDAATWGRIKDRLLGTGVIYATPGGLVHTLSM